MIDWLICGRTQGTLSKKAGQAFNVTLSAALNATLNAIL
ncbi:MAG: hypothetical protein ACI9BC_002832, partial [Crocinitomicaceae bacterium]